MLPRDCLTREKYFKTLSSLAALWFVNREIPPSSCRVKNISVWSNFLKNWSEEGQGPHLPVLECERDGGVGLRQAHPPQWLRHKVRVFFVFSWSFKCKAAWQEHQIKLCSHAREDYKSTIILSKKTVLSFEFYVNILIWPYTYISLYLWNIFFMMKAMWENLHWRGDIRELLLELIRRSV